MQQKVPKSHTKKTTYSLLTILLVVCAFAIIMLVAVSNRTLSGRAAAITTDPSIGGGGGGGVLEPRAPLAPSRYRVSTLCRDTDGGLNYDKQGTSCSGDYCKKDVCSNGKLLIEYYCDKTGRLTYEKYACACTDGACNQVETPPQLPADYCKDEDGKDIYTPGSVYGMAYGSAFKYADACQDEETVLEYLCDADKPYKVGYTCEQGCFDGRCNKESVELPTGGCVLVKLAGECPSGYQCAYGFAQVQERYYESTDGSCTGLQVDQSTLIPIQCNQQLGSVPCRPYQEGAEPGRGDAETYSNSEGFVCCK